MGNNPLQSLNPRHYKILDLYLAGLKKVEIAERLDMTAKQVGIITNSPNFQHELALRMARINELSDAKLASQIDEVTSTLKRATLEAAEKIIGKMDSIEEGISFKAACEVLDRGGFPKASRLESNQPLAPQIILTAEQVGCLAEALKDEQIKPDAKSEEKENKTD